MQTRARIELCSVFVCEGVVCLVSSCHQPIIVTSSDTLLQSQSQHTSASLLLVWVCE